MSVCNFLFLCLLAISMMPRKYIAVSEASRMQYTEETTKAALRALAEGMPVKRAASQFHIPYTTLHSRLSQVNRVWETWRKAALTTSEELVIAQNLAALADFGYAFDVICLREFVQSYVTASGRLVPHFVDGLPGNDWAYGFLESHKNLLSNRVCQNIVRKLQRMRKI